jgi:glucans biosynthesis protein C
MLLAMTRSFLSIFRPNYFPPPFSSKRIHVKIARNKSNIAGGGMSEDLKVESQKPVGGAGRVGFIDNLRVFLTVDVVMHHTACTYGNVGGWIYHENRQDTITQVLLGIMTAVNQAYFMSFFFMLSGYFAMQSFRKKGSRVFLKDRFMRLGIPMLVFDLAINPVMEYSKIVKFGHYKDGLAAYYTAYMSHFPGFGTGPLWFVELLLIFSVCFVLWMKFAKRKPQGDKRDACIPGNAKIVVFAFVMGAIAFGVRQFMPVGKSIPFLNIQLPYCPLYIAMFIVGIAANERGWFEALQERTGKTWLTVAIVASALCPVIMVVGGALKGDVTVFTGGWHWQAAMYAFWEPFVCVGMSIGLFALFRKRFNKQGRVLKIMAQNAYTVYIIHAAVLFYLSLALIGNYWHPLIKFAGVSFLTVSICFLMSNYIIRRIPGAKRIL